MWSRVKDVQQRCAIRAIHPLQKLSPDLAAQLCYQIWVTPAYWRRTSHTWELPRPTRTSIEHLGRRLTTYRWGRVGPTVMLAHGWGGAATDLSSFIGPLLDSGFRVVAVDLPAHGESTGRQTDLVSLSKALGFAGRHEGELHAVVAHSVGAVATLLALRDELLPVTGGVVLLAPLVDAQLSFRRFTQAQILNAETSQRLQELVDLRLGADFWERTSALRAAKFVNLPVFMAHDLEDPEVPFDHAASLADTLANVALVPTQGLGHRRLLRHPGVIDRAVRFIAGLEQRDPRPAS